MGGISVKKPNLATVLLPISKAPHSGKNTEMETTLYDRIKQRLEALGLTETSAARNAGLSLDAIRNIRRRLENKEKNVGISSTTAERLAEVLDVSVDWLVSGGDGGMAEETPAYTPSKPNASFPPIYQAFSGLNSIPLLGQTSAGPNGRFILNGSEVGRVFTPPMLEGVEGAYAVRVYGTSMEPRYFAGETVWINPREPVRAGDDVVVQLLTDVEHERETYIKKYVSRSSKVTRLYQYNPDEGEIPDLEYPSDRVFSVHKIVFHSAV